MTKRTYRPIPREEPESLAPAPPAPARSTVRIEERAAEPESTVPLVELRKPPSPTPSRVLAAAKVLPPPRRTTIEVELDWLEVVDEPARQTPPRADREPSSQSARPTRRPRK